VIPVFNSVARWSRCYGRKITEGLRPGTPLHLYLPGPHRGVWNEKALARRKKSFCAKSLIDALTFWCAGYRNVTASYGVNGFTPDHRAAMKKHRTRRVYIAYDRDEAGEKAAAALADGTAGNGHRCSGCSSARPGRQRVALKNQPAAKFLGMYLTRAAWLGKGKRPSTTAVTQATATPAPQEEREPMENQESTLAATTLEAEPAAKEKTVIEETAAIPVRAFFLSRHPDSAACEEAAPQRPMPLAAPAAPASGNRSGRDRRPIGPRTYRVLGWRNAPAADRCA